MMRSVAQRALCLCIFPICVVFRSVHLCLQVFTSRSLNLISSDFVFTLKAVCFPISATLVIDPSHVQLAKWG